MIRVYRPTHTMISTRLLVLSLLATLMLPLLGGMPQPILPPALTAPEPAAGQLVAEQLARLPLAFEHAAQGAGSAQFQARALGGTLFFAPAEVLLARPDSAALRVRFLGADPAAAVEPSDPLPGRVSRFIGDDPTQWQSDLPTSAALVYRRLYPGIDLRYDGASQRLKGTYLVAPGADPAPIRWRYDGAQAVRLDPGGDLLITLAASTAGGTPQTLAERAPVAWQDTATERVPVSVAYDLAVDGSVGFRLDHYDPALPLVIDPTLEFSSYLGGVGNDHIYDIVFDPQGNIYVAGYTEASNFPVRPGAYQLTSGGKKDVVVLKLSPTGTTVLWSTYLGGSDEDWEPQILVDGRGITVVGNTKSPDFPTTPPYPVEGDDNKDTNIFATHLDANGTKLLWSRYLSGPADDSVNGAVLDAQGRVTLVGSITRSGGFLDGITPVYPPDLPSPEWGGPVIVQLDSTGAITFHAFLNKASYVYGLAIALAPDGIVVGVGANSPSGGDDVFVVKLSRNATALSWTTKLAGSRKDGLLDLTVDSAGAIYAVGMTESVDFLDRVSSDPSTGADGYMVKLSPDGEPVPTHFEAGNGIDEIRRVALDRQGNVHLLGFTTSSQNLGPLTALNVRPASLNGSANILLVKLASDGRTVLSRSLLGGDRADQAWALAVTPTGQVALGGFTYSTDLGLRNELQKHRIDPARPSEIEALLMLIDTAPQLELKGSSNPPVLPPCAADLCPPVSFAWTLDSPYRVDTTLAITVPQGLEVVPGTVSGAALNGNILRASGSPQPGSPLRVSYQARPRASLQAGSMLTTLARAGTPDGLVFERNLTLALPNPLPPGQDRTLVLVYASGDNNLRDAMLLLANKAERAAATPNVVTLLVLDGPGPDDAHLYKLQPTSPNQPDCSERLRDFSCGGRYKLDQTYQKWPDSVASAATLADFLVSAQQAYPATRRVLSLVGHGGGWAPNVVDSQPDRHPGQPSRHGGQDSGNLGGMLWDDHSPSSLSTIELASALKTSKDATGTTFDLLYLDACNMAQIEVAYELRDSARFLLASPNWKWAAFPYHEHLKDATKGDGKQIGEAWIANEREALAEHKDEPYTFTLINLDQIGALRTQADTLARSLMDLPLPQEQLLPRIQTAFQRADRYDGNQDGVLDERDTTVDLGSFAARLEVELRGQSNATPVLNAARQVQQALKSAVVEFSKLDGKPWLPNSNTWEWRDTTSAGLPIYLPLGQNDDWRRRYYRAMDFGYENNKDSAWMTMLDWLWDDAAPPDDPICDQPCVPIGPQLRPVLPAIFLPLVRR